MKEKTAESILATSPWLKVTAGIVGIVFLLLVILGIFWSPMPKTFWVNEYVDDNRRVVGYSTTNTLIRVAETLLDKRDGYLTNDKFPPGLWLDNMPNWEQGVLTQVRDLALRLASLDQRLSGGAQTVDLCRVSVHKGRIERARSQW